MALRGEADLAAFDGEAVLAATRDAAGDAVLSVAEFTTNEFSLVYVADEVLELYRDEAHLREHYDRVLAHLHLDFMERDTLENALLPNAGDVRAIVTRMEEMTLLRMLGADDGVYIALDPDASVGDVIDAVEPVVAGA